MRNNQPITQREFVFDDRATLMSTTDLQQPHHLRQRRLY